MYEVLPVGCPFIIGGGLIRDAILGGRPSDIDVWLPGNILRAGVADFVSKLNVDFPAAEINIVFQLGTQVTSEFDELSPTLREEGENYGDLNNHWVLEMQVEGWPKVNFMRSLHPWTTPQPFFNSLMRNFDIDHCMFFIGWMPGQRDVNTVIMPQHMINNRYRDYRLNEIYWNQHRLNTTSAARVESRLIKMASKYMYSFLTVEEIEQYDRILRTDSIHATPVLFRQAMRRLSVLPMPTRWNNREVTQEEWDLSVSEVRATAQRRAQRYREHAQHQLNLREGFVTLPRG